MGLTVNVKIKKDNLMRLTKFTDNAFRVLIFAANHPDRLINISEIAEMCAVPRNHLTKVIHTMSKQGFLETVRGKGGGVRLARPPEEITVASVVRIMEGDMDIIECFVPRCPIVPVCKLRGILNDGRDAFLLSLEKHTIADLVVNNIHF